VAHFLTDLHAHLLPGVDDGARTFAEAALHLEEAFRDGVREIILTPHLDATRLDAAEMKRIVDLHRSVLADLRDWCRDLGGVPALGLGHEVLVRTPEQARRVLEVEDVGLGGTPWTLVEFGFDGGGRPMDVIRTLRDGGRRVVVAHPERYGFARGSEPVETVRTWRREGAALQLDGGSFEGWYGSEAHRIAVTLLLEGTADLVASDHHGDMRPHRLLPAARYASFRCGPEEALRLTARNPQRLLRGAPLEPRKRERASAPGKGKGFAPTPSALAVEG